MENSFMKNAGGPGYLNVSAGPDTLWLKNKADKRNRLPAFFIL
jgi:hypothetical protein